MEVGVLPRSRIKSAFDAEELEWLFQVTG